MEMELRNDRYVDLIRIILSSSFDAFLKVFYQKLRLLLGEVREGSNFHWFIIVFNQKFLSVKVVVL